MKEKFKLLMERSKPTFKKIMVMFVLSITLICGFSIGYLYNKTYSPKTPSIKMISLDKSEVNLAIDENNHLMVINKNTGDYTIYEDSIGVSIFNMYARNIINK
jgi:hypothetical protein